MARSGLKLATYGLHVAALTTRRRCLHTQNKEYKHSPLTVALLGMLKGFKLDKSLYLP